MNAGRLEEFLRTLPPGRHYAFEFRHASWNCDRIYELLRAFNAAYCMFHLAGFESPLQVTADFAYIRLHGPGGKYQGSYDGGALNAWACRIREWRKALRSIFVYFDNDEAGYAAKDALRLREMTGSF